MAKEEIKKAMSEAALDAKAKRQLAKAGLGEKELISLKEKYGARAYDLVAAAMYPDNVRKALGWEKFKKSSATIKEFIANPLTPEQIENVTGKKADIAKSVTPETKTRAETKATLKQQRDETDKKITEAKSKKTAKPEKTTKKIEPEKNKPYTMTWANDVNKPLTLTPDTVRTNIEKQSDGHTITFNSSIKDYKGIIIPEIAGATNDSIWDVTYIREVGSQSNPVGCRGVSKNRRTGKITEYWGAMQYNQHGLENIAIYALTHPEYKNIADKFFAPGYEKALKEFEENIKKYGKDYAYAIGSSSRKALAKYLKPNYKTLFQEEGKKNSEQFLQLQRDVSSDITSSFHAKNYKAIVETLAKNNIKPEQVHPAIWGMITSIGIARGNIDGIAKSFAGKDLSYINSPKMIDALRAKYPGVFHLGLKNEKKAYEYAKAHVHEKHSATTSRELAMMLNMPEIYTNYLQQVAQNNVKSANGQYIAKGKAQAPVTQTAWNQQGMNQSL